jgi:hypothetical protein
MIEETFFREGEAVFILEFCARLTTWSKNDDELAIGDTGIVTRKDLKPKTPFSFVPPFDSVDSTVPETLAGTNQYELPSISYPHRAAT